jgi:hypothetical protein
MARRKNTRRFDPRYFMDEKTDIITEAGKPLPDDPGPIVRDPEAPFKLDPAGDWDKYWADDEASQKNPKAKQPPEQEMKIGYADGYFYDTPGYKYDEDLARRSESYREGYRDGQEQRERDEVLDKDDAEAERLSALDDADAAADY